MYDFLAKDFTRFCNANLPIFYDNEIGSRRTESTPGDIGRGCRDPASHGKDIGFYNESHLLVKASTSNSRGQSEAESNRNHSELAVLSAVAGGASQDGATESMTPKPSSSTSSATMLTAGPSVSASLAPSAATSTVPGSKWMKVCQTLHPTPCNLQPTTQTRHPKLSNLPPKI